MLLTQFTRGPRASAPAGPKRVGKIANGASNSKSGRDRTWFLLEITPSLDAVV